MCLSQVSTNLMTKTAMHHVSVRNPGPSFQLKHSSRETPGAYLELKAGLIQEPLVQDGCILIDGPQEDSGRQWGWLDLDPFQSSGSLIAVIQHK